MRYFAAGLTIGLATLGSAQDAEVHHGDAPHSDGARLDVTRRPDASGRSSALSGSPLFFEVSGVAGSKNPVVDVGDFRLRVKVTADALVDDKPPKPLGTTEFELDLCTDVVGVACPLAVGDEFSGIASWHAVLVPDSVDAIAEHVVVKVAQPQGSACGQTFEFDGLIEKIPAEETGELLDDHLHLLLQKDGGEAAPSWKKGHSPRFEGYSWEDARRIAGGTVMRGHLGFEELPVRRYIKESTDPADSAVADAGAVAEGRRLISEEIPVNFDSRTAFPECASVIGRVRDQSDCGSCWAFASTEAFNDRRCISGIGKEGSDAGEATADQLLVLSAEDTTACCHGFRCGLSMGCNGGQPGSAWGWFTKTGVVSGGDYADIGTGTTCKPYEFMPCAHHVDPGASGYPACPDHEYPTPECFKECSETSFSGGTYGEDKKMAREAYSLGGIEDIQLDMMKYGSVTAAFSVYSDFLTYAGGVYSFDSGSYMGGHAVKIIGWGTDDESGEDYWLVANSWNPSWGEGGMFRILRGVNECGIEGQIVTGEV